MTRSAVSVGRRAPLSLAFRRSLSLSLARSHATRFSTLRSPTTRAFPSRFFPPFFPSRTLSSRRRLARSRSVRRDGAPSVSLVRSWNVHSRLPFDAEQARNERNRNLSSRLSPPPSLLALLASRASDSDSPVPRRPALSALSALSAHGPVPVPVPCVRPSLLVRALLFSPPVSFVLLRSPPFSSVLLGSPTFSFALPGRVSFSLAVPRAAVSPRGARATRRPRSEPRRRGALSETGWRDGRPATRFGIVINWPDCCSTHTADHPLCDHRSHPTFTHPFFLHSRRTSTKGTRPRCARLRGYAPLHAGLGPENSGSCSIGPIAPRLGMRGCPRFPGLEPRSEQRIPPDRSNRSPMKNSRPNRTSADST